MLFLSGNVCIGFGNGSVDTDITPTSQSQHRDRDRGTGTTRSTTATSTATSSPSYSPVLTGSVLTGVLTGSPYARYPPSKYLQDETSSTCKYRDQSSFIQDSVKDSVKSGIQPLYKGPMKR